MTFAEWLKELFRRVLEFFEKNKISISGSFRFGEHHPVVCLQVVEGEIQYQLQLPS